MIKVFAFLAIIFMGAAVALDCSAWPNNSADFSSYNVTTGEEAWNFLLCGNQRFVNEVSISPNTTVSRRTWLTTGQWPRAIVITCSDSRVAPELLFNVGLGDIFVIRVAGNVISPELLGSIDYGVEHLGAKLIVVMGHQKCGAVSAALQQVISQSTTTDDLNLDATLSYIIPPAQTIYNQYKTQIQANNNQATAASVKAAVELNAKTACSQMFTNSPVVREAVEAGSLKIVVAEYMLNGTVFELGGEEICPQDESLVFDYKLSTQTRLTDFKGNQISGDLAWSVMMEGNTRFIRDLTAPTNVTENRRAQLSFGQYPAAIVVTCADSRVPPELLFNMGLGDIFVVRVAGNIITPELLGSIDYGIEHLGANLVVIMGHDKCGAVSAALQNAIDHATTTGDHNLDALLTYVTPAAQDTLSQLGPSAVTPSGKPTGAALNMAIDLNAKRACNQLVTNSEVVRHNVETNSLFRIKVAHYKFDGTVEELAGVSCTESEEFAFIGHPPPPHGDLAEELKKQKDATLATGLVVGFGAFFLGMGAMAAYLKYKASMDNKTETTKAQPTAPQQTETKQDATAPPQSQPEPQAQPSSPPVEESTVQVVINSDDSTTIGVVEAK